MYMAKSDRHRMHKPATPLTSLRPSALSVFLSDFLLSEGDLYVKSMNSMFNHQLKLENGDSK